MLIRPAARVIRLVRLAKATKRLRFNEPLNHCEEYKMREWLTDFRQTIESATECLLRFDEAESSRPQAEGKWSAKEVMGHLIDSAANNHARFVLAQLRDDLVFPGYEQNRWVDIQNYREASWPQLVDLWTAYNRHLVHVMSYAADDKLSQRRSQHTLRTIAFET